MDMSRVPMNQGGADYRKIPQPLIETSIPSGFSVSQAPMTAPPVIPRRLTNGLNSNINNQFHAGYGTGYGSIYGNPYQNHFNHTSAPGYGYSSPYSTPYNNNQSLTNGVEDVTRSTFQSVESIIQAFSSVSMMLESTLFAVQNSIRAMASVADQFTNLKHQLFSSLLSTLRTIKNYFRKLLIMFKVRKPLSSDQVWEELANGATSTNGTSPQTKHWPLVMFFAVTVGMPWMLYKLMRLINIEQQSNNSWEKGQGDHYIGEVTYDYTAENQDEISLNTKDIINIAPKDKQPNVKGWLLASNGNKKGLVPANYIKILGKNRNSEKLLLSNKTADSVSNEEVQSKIKNNEDTVKETKTSEYIDASS